MIGRLRQLVNRAGFDVVRHPHWNSVPWALRHLLPQLGIDCVLDVGGHYGEYGRMLREIGYSGYIVSFEPVPESFARLQAHAAKDERWTAHPWALGVEEGTLPLNVTDGDVFSSFLEPDAAAGGVYSSALEIRERRQVPVRRLDSVLDEVTSSLRNPSLFLKSDTQGYDFQVIQGAGDAAARLKGLQVELALQPLYLGMRGFNESLQALGDAGFELFCLSPVTHDASMRVIEYDCVMRRVAASR
jgi:FkbM family methyltransferase